MPYEPDLLLVNANVLTMDPGRPTASAVAVAGGRTVAIFDGKPDVSAKEVDKHTFYHLREDGGTKISSAYRTAKTLLDAHYSPDEWNIYLFHFSDGDNSSEADSRDCVKLLKEQLLPVCNMFGYCQVASAYGSGNFINVLHEHLRNHEKVLTSRVNSKDDIYDSIKTFFGKGH